jgi:hypothetical protein
MDIQTIVCVTTLISLGAMPILALLYCAIFAKDNPDQIDKDGNFIPGPGVKCDICGRYLKDHGMWECEMYC